MKQERGLEKQRGREMEREREGQGGCWEAMAEGKRVGKEEARGVPLMPAATLAC